MKKLIFLELIIVTLLYVSPTITLANVVDVDISGFAFNPPTVTVAEGDTVRWTNNDAVTHTANSTSSPLVWDSGNLSRGQSFFFQFNTAGTYPYFCNIHP